MVKDGKLKILFPELESGNVVRLTEMPMRASMLPVPRRSLLKSMRQGDYD
jgi:hypothetical protein